jgi:hypothetical protein
MKRRLRIVLTVATLAATLMGLAVLARLGDGVEGPLSTMLDVAGTAFASAEHATRNRFRGAGRHTALAWFEPYRRDPARLRHPDRLLLGAYDSGIPQTLDGISQLDRTLGTALPLIQLYSAWGDKPEERFPLQPVTAIWDMGSVPLVTWEPWLADFSNAQHPQLPIQRERDRHGLAAVARGDYDFYINAWAADAKRFGHPFFVRFGHEMNDAYRYPWGPQNNSKEEYIAAWRHVVERCRDVGATNVIWVWSPHVAYEYWDLYYPGDSYVDWVATGALNFGPIAQWSRWWSFAEIFGRKYPRLESFGKPVMIAEFGSLAVGGDRAAWYRAALDSLPSAYPAVHALLFFNVREDQTVTYQKVDWTFSEDSSVASAIRTSIEPLSRR